MRPFKYALAALFAFAPLAQAQTVHVTPDRARVFPLSDGSFEVAPPRGQVLDGYWCAAADYARRGLGADWGQDIYVARGLGDGVAINRTSTVIFTLTPVPSDKPDRFITRTNAVHVGDRLNVQEADHKCSIVRRRF